MRTGFRVVALAAATAAFGTAAARADDAAATERERELERRVAEQERRLAEMQSRLDEMNRQFTEGGASASGGELEARVAELERLTKVEQDGLFAYWKNGIRMDSASGAFALKIGGRIQNDWAWFYGENEASEFSGSEIEPGTEFRRARLHVGGKMYDNVDFMAEYDFAGGGTKFREVWIGLDMCALGHLQVGSFKEPFGLEENVSDLNTTFMERSAPSAAFAPSYNTGIMLSDACADDRVFWAIGGFRNANDAGNAVGNTDSADMNLTARVAGRPWVNNAGDGYIHVGVAGSWRETSDGTVRYASKPEMNMAPLLVDTGEIVAGRALLGEFEFGGVWGPFSTVAEYYRSDIRTGTEYAVDPGDEVVLPSDKHPVLQGWAFQASWFLTGENRPYNAKKGVFDRVLPKNNHDGASNWGAFELAGRWDRVDLSTLDISGGEMETWTIALNWYLNPNTRFVIEFVRAKEAEIDALNALQCRFQVDF